MGVDLSKLEDYAREQGWRVTSAGSNRVEFHSPEGKTVSGTCHPSDARAHLNLRSELRRAGLQVPAQLDPKQEHRREGTDAPQDDKEAHAGRGELLACVRAIFAEQPEHIFTIEEVWTRVHARLPVAKRTSTEQTLYTMRTRGEIKRLDQGQYRYVRGDWQQGRYIPAPPAVPAAQEAPFQGGGVPAGASVGDEVGDADARTLDEALATLGRMQERIVERVRAVVEEEVQRALEPLAKIDTVVRSTREGLAAVARARAALKAL